MASLVFLYYLLIAPRAYCVCVRAKVSSCLGTAKSWDDIMLVKELTELS